MNVDLVAPPIEHPQPNPDAYVPGVHPFPNVPLDVASDDSGWDRGIPMRAVMQVIDKLSTGVYKTEPTICFCGADAATYDTEIVKWDRYAIPHRMVLCEKCMLIRANPRMTAESYDQFYNTEYRTIYDGFVMGPNMYKPELTFQHQQKQILSIRNAMEQFEIATPKIGVLDFGSNKGGTLLMFQSEGIPVLGVEWDDESRAYAESRGIPCVRTLDAAIAAGFKADFIIMQDVIEHLFDLRVELEKIKQLLTPDGCVFIYTPGLLATPPSRAFQNAHTYQFIGETLDYVMQSCGFFGDFVDDQVVSVWRAVEVPLKPELPTNWRPFIMQHLNQVERRQVPPVRTRCKFGTKVMVDHLTENLKKTYPTLDQIAGTKSGPVIVIGGGPSVDGQIEKIRELQAKGYATVVIDRMYPWATKHGIKADYVMILDASDDIGDGLTDLQDGTIHFVVASAHPSVLPLLEGRSVYLFSGISGLAPEVPKIWSDAGYKRLMIVATGGSVALGSIYLGIILGHRNVHMFGFDCMVPNEQHQYATGVAGKSVDRKYFTVEIDGHSVLTCSSFLAFAQQFFRMVEKAREQGMIDTIDVYGESLVNYMFDDTDVGPQVIMSTHATLPEDGVVNA